MSFSSFPNAELRRQHFCKGQLWIVTRELWLTIKKSIITATFPKKFVMLRELETWPQKVRASSQAPAFPGAHLQLSHWCPATDVIHFYTLQCKGLIPISQMMKLKHRKLCISTLCYWLMGLQLDLYLDSNDWPPSNSTIARRLMSLAVLLLTILSALLLKKVLGATFMSPCSYNLPLCRILCWESSPIWQRKPVTSI